MLQTSNFNQIDKNSTSHIQCILMSQIYLIGILVFTTVVFFHNLRIVIFCSVPSYSSLPYICLDKMLFLYCSHLCDSIPPDNKFVLLGVYFESLDNMDKSTKVVVHSPNTTKCLLQFGLSQLFRTYIFFHKMLVGSGNIILVRIVIHFCDIN